MVKANSPWLRFFLVTLIMFILIPSVVVADNWWERTHRDEVIYFVMPDRFNNADSSNDLGDFDPNGIDPTSEEAILTHGFLPSDHSYFHGGDLRGVIEKIDYLQRMGITAIWITPIFENKAVQFDDGPRTIESGSSAYHGYWITNFLTVDPHLGTEADLKELVDLAHSRGMKVFLDIITNHTANVITFEEGWAPDYISKEEMPYVDIYDNEFDDADYAWAYTDGTEFPQMDITSFPYEPIVSAEEADIKHPYWLNDVTLYHNRGASTFAGENSVYGDFIILDDLMTTHPQVVGGMIEIYKHWIEEYRIDGFRIDTVKHVNLEFWQQFAPEVSEFAASIGIPDFFMFGEVYSGDPQYLSTFTTTGQLNAVLDFGFQGAILGQVSGGDPTNNLADFFAMDDFYTDADSSAYDNPTFLGNHDMGRIGGFILRDHPTEDEELLLKRTILAHQLMFMSRGVPTIYYGDEQGFTGVVDGAINDKIARQNMFPSAVEYFGDPVSNNQIGTDATPADDNFDMRHPLYREIRRLSRFRRWSPAITDGAQLPRYSTDEAGIFAFSRIHMDDAREYLVVANTHPTEEKTVVIDTLHNNSLFMQTYPFKWWGGTWTFSDQEGAIEVTIPPMSMKVLTSLRRLPRWDRTVPDVTITGPTSTYEQGKFWVEAELSEEDFVEMVFYVDKGDGNWEYMGSDFNAPYRVQFDSTELPLGTTLKFKVEAEKYTGRSSVALLEGIVIENRLPDVELYYENGNGRNSYFAITDGGAMFFPTDLVNNTLNFSWPEGVSEITFFFESEYDPYFEFDVPITLSLKGEIYPNAYEENGELYSTVYINNIGEKASSDNYVGAPLPESLGVDANAPNYFDVPIYIRGGLNGWGTADELTYLGNYSYSKVLDIVGGSTEFKFADDSWSSNTNTGVPMTNDGLTVGANPGNLRFEVPETGRYAVHFFNYPWSDDGNDSRLSFYRFEYLGPIEVDPGPFGQLYLRGGSAVSADPWGTPEENLFVYNADTQTLSLTLNVTSTSTDNGDWQFKLATADWGTQLTGSSGTWYDPANEVVAGEAYDLGFGLETLWVQKVTGVYNFSIDVSDPADPILTLVVEADPGPYGKVYLRGGAAISPSGWDANDANLLSYSAAEQTLSITVEVDSSSTDDGDWQFKIADESWVFQLTGQTNNWYDPANEVLAGVPYILGNGLQTLWVQKVNGTYSFSVDVSDTDNPVLTVTIE
jgi:glycosidase